MKKVDPKWFAEKQQTSIQDDNPAAHVVHKDVNTLCREPVQNSNDQAVNKDKPVRVKYSIISLTGDFKERFLEAMNWQDLRVHLKAIAEIENTSNLADKIRNGLRVIDENENLNLLMVEDYNTKGLIGGEFDDEGDENNFILFGKADFSTSSTQGRGGSYGIGKYVFWQFSNISTVLMSSRVSGRESDGLRIFGRCHVPSHKLENKKYGNNIYFPTSGEDDEIEKGKSSWGEPSFAKDLYLDRSKMEGTGTSIISVGFPEMVENFATEEILDEIRKKLITWFWPCLIGGKPGNIFELERYENNLMVESYNISKPGYEWRPYIDAFQKNKNTEKAKLEGDVADSNIMVKIPKRIRKQVHESFETNVLLRASRQGEDYKEHSYANHIALIRNSRMVIKYHKPGQKPLNDNLPYFGVLKLGLLLDDTVENRWSNEFFRCAEPPLHDDLTGDTNKASNLIPNYGERSGAKTYLEQMKKDINDKIFELIDQKAEVNESGPKDLAKLFNFGDDGSKKGKKKFNTHIANNEFNNGVWTFEGKIKRIDIDHLSQEEINFGFKCETDSGLGEYLEFESISFSERSVSVISDGPPAKINIPDDVEAFDFEVKLKNNDVIKKSDLNYTSIKLAT